MSRKLIMALALVLFSISSFGQVGAGALKGKIIDQDNGMPLPFVNVVVQQDGNQVAGGTSDFDGNYTIKPLSAGKYDVVIKFIGYKPIMVAGVVVNSSKTTVVPESRLATSAEVLDVVEVVAYTVPLFEKDQTVNSTTVTKDDIKNMAARSVQDIAATSGGVFKKDDGSGTLNVRGGRAAANYIYIDGVKIRGSSNLPQSAYGEVSVIQSGVPAMYGDAMGGIVSVTTRSTSKDIHGSLEYQSSGYKVGDQAYGLDKFGFNYLEFSLTGPLLMRKDDAGKKSQKPLMGFLLSGSARSQIDGRPSIIGSWKIKDDVLDSLSQNPVTRLEGRRGTFSTAEFLRLNDFEKVRTRMNAASKMISIFGKVDIFTGPSMDITVGGKFNFNNSHVSNNSTSTSRNATFGNSLMNWNNNPYNENWQWMGYLKFTQRFNQEGSSTESNASIIKNAFYTVQVDYTQTRNNRWDENHKDDYFKYGHYGKYKRFISKTYAPGQDTATNGFGLIHQTNVDTLIGFEPGTANPEGTKYVESYYNLYGWKGYDENGNPVYDHLLADGDRTDDLENEFLRSTLNIQTFGGLINGGIPASPYNMWRSHAYQYNGHEKNQNDQYRLTLMGSADIGNHAITIGFEAEQRVDRSYSISPIGLWTIGRQHVNSHITNLDKREQSLSKTRLGSYYRYDYPRLNSSPGEYSADDNQSFFDYNLRNALGLDPDGIDDIDFDNIDPETLKLDFFSVDELLNSGSPYVTYYGYDAFGNKNTKTPTFDDFFTATDDFGNATRNIDAFRPIYMAGYIQDKFVFDDLIFNVGLRIDRYDANQKVLKDPYVLFPTVKAGEDKVSALLGDGESIPSNIGDDYVVYVDDIESPENIVGYRNGKVWYNAQGIELDDPDVLATSSGIAPFLSDPTVTRSRDISADAFEDYTPSINYMPRIAFSFPISDEANFSAHYDILTRRPDGDITRMKITDYYFMDSFIGTANNPRLKPSTTIDYEVGFKQKLTSFAALGLSAFYREQRNQIQMVNTTQAYPKEYRSFGNIDFGTVKGVQIKYDMRRKNNVQMRAFYTLQFAEGTGSDRLTAATLIRAGKDNLKTTNPYNFDQRHAFSINLDYRYSSGTDYNGPVILNNQIFANAGANFQVNVGSGTPYNAAQNVTGAGLFSGGGSALLEGSINGARLPWTTLVNARIDKTFSMTIGGDGEKSKDINMNVYFNIQNLLNSKNIYAVYRATGSPTDDGYLQDAVFQTEINNSTNEQSFREMYLMRINNPNRYGLPRRIRLGILVSF